MEKPLHHNPLLEPSPVVYLNAGGCQMATALDINASGVVFPVEWSDTLAPNSWSTAGVTQGIPTDNGTLQSIKASVPVVLTKKWGFARLKATQPRNQRRIQIPRPRSNRTFMRTPKAIIHSWAIGMAACQCLAAEVKQERYGNMPDGREVSIYTLTNKNGLKARVMDYGAILVSMEVPDKAGKTADITHGYDTLDGWLTNTSYFGSSVGRFGNRIKDGKFTLDGKTYTLATNNDPGGIPCHLHGGVKGFDKVLWSSRITSDNGVEFSYLSKDGEEGYPGNLDVKVTYSLNDENELKWEASATTDAPTVLNLVHHSYWNLSGDPANTINDHELMLAAPNFLPTNIGLIPTGILAPVAGTPMDFTKPQIIGERVDADTEALKFGGGYDHCWVLEKGTGVRLAARLKHPTSGRIMEISTDQPAIQFYGGNFLDGTVAGKGGVKYAKRTALCLESEGFPNSPNEPSFPSPVLRPGQTYQHRMIHKFLTD